MATLVANAGADVNTKSVSALGFGPLWFYIHYMLHHHGALMLFSKYEVL